MKVNEPWRVSETCELDNVQMLPRCKGWTGLFYGLKTHDQQGVVVPCFLSYMGVTVKQGLTNEMVSEYNELMTIVIEDTYD